MISFLCSTSLGKLILTPLRDIMFFIILNICFRFHRIALQLKHRHANRKTIEIADEYDVQDLLHAVLCIDFDDIRPEEWTPSYAGKSARVDFLLKEQKIVIEVKKTRDSLFNTMKE